MKISIKPTSSFWRLVLLGTLQVGLAIAYFLFRPDLAPDHRLISSIWMIAGVVSIYRGIKEFEHRWEVTTNGRFFNITKNGSCVFEGLPSQLLAIKRVHDMYEVYPRKGEYFTVSLLDADQTLIQLYQEYKRSPQDTP